MKFCSPWRPFIALLFGSFVVVEAAAFQVPAMPFIVRDFGIPVTFAGAISICYYAAGIVFAPIMGRLGDHIGRKQLTLIGLIIFSLSEFLAAMSPTFVIFLIARFIQGIGYACILPTILAFIKDLFPEGKRGFPLGIFGAVGTLGAASGGIVAGLLIEKFGWPSIYWFTGIFAIVSIFIIALFVPKTERGKIQSIDYLGSVALLISVGSIVSLPMLITSLGWSSKVTLAVFASAAIGLLALVFFEKRAKNPVMDFKILKLPSIYIPSSVIILLTFSQISLTYAISFFVAGVPGWGAVEVGLVGTFNYAMASLSNPAIGWLNDKYKPQYFVVFGIAMLTIAAFLYTFIDIESPFWFILAVSSLISFSLGTAQTSIKTVVVTNVPEEKSGAGTGIFSMFKDLGIPLGSTFGLGLYGLQQRTQTENILLENARQAGISEELFPAIADAGETQEITPELADQLQSLGISFEELLNKSTLEGMTVALGDVGYVIMAVLGVCFLLSLLLLRKRKPLHNNEIKSNPV
jgi:multidrug resistance protein